MPADRLRVALTGASGFTGRHLVPLLAAHGDEVVPLGAHGTANPKEGDILDLAWLMAATAQAAPDVIIHLAAMSFAGGGDVERTYRTNIMGTRNLLEAAAALPSPPRMILASSAGVYRASGERPLDEASAIAPQNDYLISKLASELLADLYRDRLPIVIVRPFNYSGVGQSPSFLVPKLVAAFQRRDAELVLGNIEVHRDFTDVRDVAAAYAGLCRADCPPIVNICSGQATSPRAMIDHLASLSGHRPAVRVDPALIRRHDAPLLVGDNSLLRQRLPAWHPRPFADTLDWMLAVKPA
jgi:nucleoside-diphosphate-sugar epimerase